MEFSFQMSVRAHAAGLSPSHDIHAAVDEIFKQHAVRGNITHRRAAAGCGKLPFTFVQSPKT